MGASIFPLFFSRISESFFRNYSSAIYLGRFSITRKRSNWALFCILAVFIGFPLKFCSISLIIWIIFVFSFTKDGRLLRFGCLSNLLKIVATHSIRFWVKGEYNTITSFYYSSTNSFIHSIRLFKIYSVVPILSNNILLPFSLIIFICARVILEIIRQMWLAKTEGGLFASHEIKTLLILVSKSSYRFY